MKKIDGLKRVLELSTGVEDWIGFRKPKKEFDVCLFHFLKPLVVTDRR